MTSVTNFRSNFSRHVHKSMSLGPSRRPLNVKSGLARLRLPIIHPYSLLDPAIYKGIRRRQVYRRLFINLEDHEHIAARAAQLRCQHMEGTRMSTWGLQVQSSTSYACDQRISYECCPRHAIEGQRVRQLTHALVCQYADVTCSSCCERSCIPRGAFGEG